ELAGGPGALDPLLGDLAVRGPGPPGGRAVVGPDPAGDDEVAGARGLDRADPAGQPAVGQPAADAPPPQVLAAGVHDGVGGVELQGVVGLARGDEVGPE